jgi:hypothetical protein
MVSQGSFIVFLLHLVIDLPLLGIEVAEGPQPPGGRSRAAFTGCGELSVYSDGRVLQLGVQ